MAEIRLPDLVARIAIDTRGLQRSLSNIESSTASVGRSVDKMGKAIAGGLALNTIKNVGLAGIRAAADFQQVEIAFEGILGSGQKAQAFLKEMRAFAARTPFELPGLTTATQQLLAVGFTTEQTLPTLEKIGNLTSALGVGAEGIDRTVRALGQMKGRGKVASQELIQISEAVPGFSAVGAIAEGMGVTTAEAFKLVEDGAVSGDRGIELILQGMEKFPGAAGAMDRQAKTLNGRLSTFRDTVRNAAIDLLKRFMPTISKAVAAVTKFVGPIAKFIAKNPGPFFGALGVVVGALAIAMGSLAASTIAAAAPFIAITAAIAAVVGGVIYAYQNFETFRNIVDGVARFIATQFASVLAYAREIWPQVSEAVGHVMNVIKSIVSTALAAIQIFWNTFGTAITTYVTTLFGSIWNIIKGAFQIIKSIFETSLALINGDWSKFWDGLEGIIEGVTTTIGGIVGLFFAPIQLAWNTGISLIKSAWQTLWDEIPGFITTAIDTAMGPVDEILGKLVDAISKARELAGLSTKRETTDPGQPGSKLNPRQPILDGGGGGTLSTSAGGGMTFNFTNANVSASQVMAAAKRAEALYAT